MLMCSRNELIKQHFNIYQWLLRNKPELLDKYFPNTVRMWNLQSVKEEALKYKTKKQFTINSSGAYKWAIKNKVIDSVCLHMIYNLKRPIICNENSQVYTCQFHASEDLGINQSCISQVLNGKKKTVKGYTFKWV